MRSWIHEIRIQNNQMGRLGTTLVTLPHDICHISESCPFRKIRFWSVKNQYFQKLFISVKVAYLDYSISKNYGKRLMELRERSILRVTFFVSSHGSIQWCSHNVYQRIWCLDLVRDSETSFFNKIKKVDRVLEVFGMDWILGKIKQWSVKCLSQR